jgi:DUF1680 family protein
MTPASDASAGPLSVRLADAFWAPRQDQLREHTLPVLLDRLEAHGVVDNFRRLSGRSSAERRGLWFTDSDLYKWMEAAAWAGRLDLLDPIVELVAAAARPDGYLHTFYDVGPGSQGRYGDLAHSHEWYCGGHLIEAALAHHEVTGSDALLDPARRWADHLCETFGPGLDQRVDAHPEVEIALVRLARRTGDDRYLVQAMWIIESQLDQAGLRVETVELAGHAVRSLYLASAIGEVARAGGPPAYDAAARRMFDSLVDEHSYPTGAVGGRWLDESIGKPYELPDAMAYAESCAAVAATQFCGRIWDLTGDVRSLEQAELLLFNAVPCGTGADGESWFYSQPQAVAEVVAESNPWVQPFEYQQSMLLKWFPARRHAWFEVTCCPTNLARMFATVDQQVAELSADGDLRVHLPVAARLTGGGWDVEIAGGYPDDGEVGVTVHAAPEGRQVLMRIPTWAGGSGHVPVPDDGRVQLPIAPQWWQTDGRVEGAAATVFLRYGPVVHCVEQVDVTDVDLRDLTVDPTLDPASAFSVVPAASPAGLHHPVEVAPAESHPDSRAESVPVVTVPYHSWANRGLTTMRVRFDRR